MKLEVGKTYVTRGGARVRIVAEFKHNFYPFIGVVTGKSGLEFIDTYDANGQRSDMLTDMDIAAEYVPPRKVEGWVNVYGLGNSLGVLHDTEDEAKKSINRFRDYVGTAFISVTEGEE